MNWQNNALFPQFGLKYFYSAALDEERKKTATLTEALTLEQMSANEYGEELETERLRIKQQQERNQHITQVCTPRFLRRMLLG